MFEPMKISHETDLTGIRYGKLVGVSKSHLKRKWVFGCDCGNVVHTFKFQVLAGRSRSCGCSEKPTFTGAKHLMYKTPEYNSWSMMKSRCLNKNVKSYRNYGAKGISICEKWLSFEGFYEDMGARPQGTSLNRINSEEGYYPDNCEWADRKTQAANKTNSMLLTINGESKRLPEWCQQFGCVSYKVAKYRIRKGWDHLMAVSVPPRSRSKGRQG
jgi:hypothetical protein